MLLRRKRSSDFESLPNVLHDDRNDQQTDTKPHVRELTPFERRPTRTLRLRQFSAVRCANDRRVGSSVGQGLSAANSRRKQTCPKADPQWHKRTNADSRALRELTALTGVPWNGVSSSRPAWTFPPEPGCRDVGKLPVPIVTLCGCRFR